MDNVIPGAVIEKQVAKLMKSEIQTAQLKLINECLLCPSFQEKTSFVEILQLFTSLGARTKINFDVRDFLLSRKQLTRQNIKEYGEIFARKKRIIQHAARNKCLNLQADLWDKHGVSVLGVNGSHWENDFDSPPWNYKDTALGLHGFDSLLTKEHYEEQVQPHTAEKISSALDSLLGDDGES